MMKGACVNVFQHGEPVCGVEYLKNSTMFVAAGGNKCKLFDVTRNREVCELGSKE